MLKTNTKKARENIRVYIVNNFTPENYTDETFSTFPGIAKFILETFRAEKFNGEMKRYYKGVESAAFADWCAGLPSLLDTCYYYNRSACDDLAEILEETETEKARYKVQHTESYAEMYLTNLIYRELKRSETA